MLALLHLEIKLEERDGIVCKRSVYLWEDHQNHASKFGEVKPLHLLE